jgi:nucleotide-binding universal stress UspA family protein
VATDEELISAFRDEAVSYLEKKAETLKQWGIDRVSYSAEYGLAADAIISFARKTPDNLIAMCTHGRTGVRRWVLGSVTETVVRHSSDPVLVIRAR